MTATVHSHTVVDTAALRRGRVAVSLLFLLSGAVIGVWTARIPTIKHTLGLSDGALSVALLSLAAGGLVGMLLVGRLVDRYGSTRVMTPMALAVGPVLTLPAYASNLTMLVLALLVLGAVHGTLNVSMNANAVQVERAYRRPLMSGIHAQFSIGGFGGAGCGGVFAAADLSPAATFTRGGGASSGRAVGAARGALPSAPVESGRTDGDRETRDRTVSFTGSPVDRVLGLLGALAFCVLVIEGAAADWSSVYLHDSLGSSAGLAAGAYAAFALLMTAGRLAGDRLVARWGPVRLVRACGLLAAFGFAAGALAGHPVAAIAGFGCLGAGLSCIVPQLYSAAGNLDPERAGHGISRVAAIGYLGFLLGPVVIGMAADLVSLAQAILILPLLALFIAACSRVVGTPRAGASRRRPPSTMSTQ